MNTITFIGNLVADPEVKANANGGSRTIFRVAVNEWQGADKEEKTHFVGVTAFRSLGENIANSLKKGQRVIVQGRLDSYTKKVQIDGEDKDLPMLSFVALSVGPDLNWQEADVRRGVTGNGGGGQRSEAKAPAAAPAAAAAPAKAPAASDDDF